MDALRFAELISNGMCETVTHTLCCSGVKPTQENVRECMKEITDATVGTRNKATPLTVADFRQLVEATVVWCARRLGREVE